MPHNLSNLVTLTADNFFVIASTRTWTPSKETSVDIFPRGIKETFQPWQGGLVLSSVETGYYGS
jgi:hypothetical protein